MIGNKCGSSTGSSAMPCPSATQPATSTPTQRAATTDRSWAPARTAAGIKHPTRQDGTHALRHHYASVLLDAGESIKALSEYLGHHDSGFTLPTYTHLMPAGTARIQPIDGGTAQDCLLRQRLLDRIVER